MKIEAVTGPPPSPEEIAAILAVLQGDAPDAGRAPKPSAWRRASRDFDETEFPR